MIVSKHIFTSAAIVFWLLFIFPEVPVSLFNANAISFSLALPFFIIWAATHPLRVLSTLQTAYKRYPLCMLFCVFSLWALFRSILSLTPVSIAYGLNHTIFIVASFSIFATMFEKSKHHPKLLKITDNTIILVGLIVAAGTIWSVYYGPIYPELNMNMEFTFRDWNGATINSGTGFSSSPNLTATYILFFLLYGFFIPKTRLKYVYCIFLLYALTATLSRTGIAALLVSLGSIGFLHLYTALRTAKIPSWLVSSIMLFIVAALCGIAYINLNPGFQTQHQAFFGFTSKQVASDVHLRLDTWAFFAKKYINDNFFDVVAGRGWRQTSVVGEWGTAWYTAHNSILIILGEFGFIGIFLMAFFVGFSFYVLGNSILKASKHSSVNSQLCFTFLASMLAEGLAEEHLLSPVLGVLLMYSLCRFHSSSSLSVQSTKEKTA